MKLSELITGIGNSSTDKFLNQIYIIETNTFNL